MEDLSLHILDIAENALRAEAQNIRIRIKEDLEANILELEVEDDGRGMDPEMARRASDPFFTTRKTRRFGLGLALLREAAEATGGELKVFSEPGRGTKILATFQRDHIDRKPLGDIGSTLVGIILGAHGANLTYMHEIDGRKFLLETEQLRREIEPLPLGNPEVLEWIRNYVNESLKEMGVSLA